jgi:hypothetical protein
MPPYLQANGNETPPTSVYPGQDGFAIGYKSVPGGPPALASAQYETITSGFKSKCIAVASQTGDRGYTQRQITWQVKYGTAPSVVAWVLQGSIDDVDADYVQVDTSSAITNFSQTVATNFRFFRLLAQTVTGAATAIGKITCM